MMNKDDFKFRLSPSRVSSYNTCSYSYACSYFYNLPRFDNNGNLVGDLVHRVLENLVKEKHKKTLNELIKKQDPYQVKKIFRLMKLISYETGVDLYKGFVNKNKTSLVSNKDLITLCIMNAVNYKEFLPPEGWQVLPEEECVEFKNEKDLRFKILGIIDKTFIWKDDNGVVKKVIITDYKTDKSKDKYNPNKLQSNIQVNTYQYFLKKKFPDAEEMKFRFHLLQFDMVVEVEPMENESIEGFEIYLDYCQSFLENFSEEKARANLAKDNGGHFLCGKDGFKKLRSGQITEELNWKCPYKDPFEYWAIVDKNLRNIKSSVRKSDLEKIKLEDGQELIKRNYEGCVGWNSTKKDLKEFWGEY